ncbi:imidazole glycerol phosphate synthase subunit HisH [Hydrogenophaga crocea]|uniref:Imidazole glycerol phosphate synthase subunit HisH n=1 Tax=Hydrogenophaga crocea TaxID=2716225 RepID=A0A6G8ILT4_9BURK|nr:imidazole glycerol phosphate synthase subunit HisH [Hydrogenophaga crocea]QIM53986.1 imidazole glycerol phosphate synthase subunit HisH [Hydrogenophaga crocea]
MITVVDYGVGNVGAILNMLDYLGIDAQASSDSEEIVVAEKLILPGVGAFDKAMVTLRERRLIDPLNTAVLVRRVPVLGVCLGMQLLARRSEEGQEDGLGYIDAEVKRIKVPQDSGLKVPHIGWMEVKPAGRGQLFGTAQGPERFYFDHGYHVVCEDSQAVSATFAYGAELCCALEQANVFGVQFHPEKSHRFGMRLLKSFEQLT